MNQLHFTINLNKYGELKQQIEAEKKTFVKMLVFFLFASIVLYGFVIYLNSNLKKKYENRKGYLTEIEKQLETFSNSSEYLSSKDLERLTRINDNRVFWAKKLVALSERTSSQIAITHFSFKNGILSLYGITKLDRGQKEFDLIDSFIYSLKQNQDISIDFPEIRFVKSTKDQEKDVEILRFQVDCISKDYGKKGTKNED
ncbi:MAG TPA: hypothetical protein PKJ08_10710 [Candidatus Cloacimonadota bacterium]|jgi:hypothetical protein|nr:hypothetical protein [Candidatus Cloacimonadota bacterium]HOD54988.1 hypothetical protein [Candidatus Cloacimonadota bacterium]HPM02759.1 hypothetical protein [Candidatus Cloacimonadota bacterium]